MNRTAGLVIAVIIVALIAFFLGYTSAQNGNTHSGNPENIGNSNTNPQFSQPTSSIMPAPAGTETTPIDIVSIHEVASTSPTITVEYPQFPNLPADFNAAIASATLSRLDQFHANITQNTSDRNTYGGPNATISPSSYDFIATWQAVQINSAYISFVERYDSFTGGANDNQDLETFNYDIADHRTMSLGDLFLNMPDYLQKISDTVRQQLTAALAQASPGYAPDFMLQDGTAPTADNFQNFTFTNYQLMLYFPKCAVAACSFGEEDVTIPLDSIR